MIACFHMKTVIIFYNQYNFEIMLRLRFAVVTQKPDVPGEL